MLAHGGGIHIAALASTWPEEEWQEERTRDEECEEERGRGRRGRSGSETRSEEAVAAAAREAREEEEGAHSTPDLTDLQWLRFPCCFFGADAQRRDLPSVVPVWGGKGGGWRGGEQVRRRRWRRRGGGEEEARRRRRGGEEEARAWRAHVLRGGVVKHEAVVRVMLLLVHDDTLEDMALLRDVAAREDRMVRR